MGLSSDEREKFEARESSQVPQVKFREVVAYIAVAPEDLDCTIGDLKGDPCGLVVGESR